MTIGKETVVVDAVEPVWQGMQQKAADEFIGRERHHLVLVMMPIVMPAAADLAPVSAISLLLAMATRCV